ncbi:MULTISPECIES: alpha/beta fold hydrolase [Phyllobacteriaceae]|uniref:Hydrolase n=1 Tax=Mesorhizobium hungaricum TaxID=1566387 RepID=A0A1C2DIV9_9HYPH|nr:MULTISPECIES: alpha/beta hydrolase [Mesorhizobium]MBN9232147.1 alpha/beta hydrolase [Mesorhizobium sp.]MDQ0332251.1 pimeloyl-ACP methyl ester carboxylesterase [Mesorhizobium sp. YL-MeA3-2017]OCX14690.1 hydrolase [Mesorhizobium hungaricum]
MAEAFSDFFYSAPDGLKLHARVYGEQHGEVLPVVCLPGLTRNARDFHELALCLSTSAETKRKVVAVDYRGRGQSAYDPNVANYNVGIEAGDILAGLDALGISEAAFIGTSRGGLIIHVLGMMKPSVLKAIVLNDVGPALEMAGLAHIKSYLERAPRPESLDEAVEAQKSAHGADFPALGDTDWRRMVAAIYRTENGKLTPDFDPKLVDTLAGVDLSKPLPTLWPQFDALTSIPMLAIRGANSRLLSGETLNEMARHHPTLQTVTVPGQGHAPFLETGDLPQLIANFIDRSERQS